MKVILNGKHSEESSVLALGMFDGVHIGHQVLLERARTLHLRYGAPVVVCTFARHPMELIAPEKAPRLLTTLEERISLISHAGADVFLAMPFDEQMRDQPPECYVGELVRRLHPKAVVCGYNHSFGAGGSGSPALLQALGVALGFEVSVVPPITLHGQEVSSTAIRQKLAAGDVSGARALLGRPYSRRVELTHGENEWSLRLLDEEKQGLPAGKYRCVFSAGEQSLPVTVLLNGETDGRLLLSGEEPSLQKSLNEGRGRLFFWQAAK